MKSNFIEYNRKVKSGEIKKPNTNQFIKAKSEGKQIIVSDETKKKISTAAKKQIWTVEKRLKHSLAMKKAVLENPESYSAKNICGRTKLINAVDSFGNKTKLNGNWELIVAEWLTKEKIKWVNKIDPFIYKWKNKSHFYFPDFYLPDLKLYIEVKGFERERDKCKWRVVENLILIKYKEIQEIKKGLYRLQFQGL